MQPIASNRLSHLLAFDHASNRLKIVFQGPNRRGKSRHGAPVLAIQRTALMKFRSPLSDGGPLLIGSHFRTSRHCSSESSCRRILLIDHANQGIASPTKACTATDRNDPTFCSDQGHPLVPCHRENDRLRLRDFVRWVGARAQSYWSISSPQRHRQRAKGPASSGHFPCGEVLGMARCDCSVRNLRGSCPV